MEIVARLTCMGLWTRHTAQDKDKDTHPLLLRGRVGRDGRMPGPFPSLEMVWKTRDWQQQWVTLGQGTDCARRVGREASLRANFQTRGHTSSVYACDPPNSNVWGQGSRWVNWPTLFDLQGKRSCHDVFNDFLSLRFHYESGQFANLQILWDSTNTVFNANPST